MKHVLVALCGMTPAVITETVYGLCHEHEIEFLEVIVVTTLQGRQCIEEQLFKSGIWEQLQKVLKTKCVVKFSLSQYHVRLLPAGTGDKDAQDILSSEDSHVMANVLLGILRQFTENPDCRIIMSIAGGRKTMSAVGALCMSLLGREKDCLCHVLVKPPFDNPELSPRFYFPGQSKIYVLPTGESVTDNDLDMSICNIPYVCCRNLFKEKFYKLPGDYLDCVALANKTLSCIQMPSPELIFDLSQQKCYIGKKELSLSNFEYMLYWILAERCQTSAVEINAAQLLDDLKIKSDGLDQNSVKYYFNIKDSCNGKTEEDITKGISSLKRKIRNTGNASSDYFPARRKGIYGLGLASETIVISPP